MGLPSSNQVQPPPAFITDPPKANPFTSTAPMGHASPFDAPPASVDVMTDDMRMLDTDATMEDAAPSRQDLLQRAAALGPSRMTWENIVLAPTDPILGEKMQPRVAERRARFRKVVKVALGACVAFCVVATGATALSSSTPTESASSTSSLTKTAPATGIVPVERLEQATRTKAPSRVTAVRPSTWKKRR